MKQQREFLEKGVSGLKPLVLREVADDVGLHESTISRVTSNKYVHTPHGVYELKFFFSSGLSSGEGDISSEVVKDRIKDMVSKEDAKKPLSDQQLVTMLKTEGIDVARRTVAKYREMLGILSSSRRKKIF
jgi:RNA polymerase sigma-54 factor